MRKRCLEDWIFYWVALAVKGFFCLFPYRIGIGFGAGVIYLLSFFYSRRFSVAYINLKSAFPHKKPGEIRWIIRRSMLNLGLSLMEFILSVKLDTEVLKEYADSFIGKGWTISSMNDQQFVAGTMQSVPEENTMQESNILFKVLGFPLYVYALLNNLLSIFAIRWIIKRFVRDHHWTSSIRFAGMILVTPLFYIIQLVLFYYFTKDWSLFWIYFASLPLSAWFGSLYWQKVSAVRF